MLKSFELVYGGYFSDSHSLVLEDGQLQYYYFSVSVPHKAVRVAYNPEQLIWFLTKLKEVTKEWLPSYYNAVCDGIQWSIDITTHTESFHFDGSNAFPRNFDAYLSVVRKFTGIRSFAGGYKV